MINPLNELSGVYLEHIAEQEGDNTPEDVKTRVMQIVKAIRYKARKEGGNIVKAFNDYMGGQSGIGAAERQMVKQRLGLQEEVGITSSEKISAAKKEAKLKLIQDKAVDKQKKALKKEENEVVDEYIDTVKKVKKAELDQDLKRWSEVEEDYETKKKGEVLGALKKKKGDFKKRYGKDAPDVMYAVAAKTAKKKGDTSKSDDRYAYEGFSNWREDLREIADDIPETDKKMEVKIKEKKVNNKIVINPVLGGSGRDMGEEIKKIGGELIEMNEVEEQVAAGGAVPLSSQEIMIAKRQAMLQTRASKQRQRTLAKVKAEKKPEEEVKEEKKVLPKLKMYRKAGNLARAGDEKSMKRQTKIVSTLNKETSKGYKKAALDKLRDGGSPKHQSEEKGFNFIKKFMKEDEALAKVKADIIKKHGKGAIYDPKNPPKSKPQPKPKAQKPLTDAEKNQREVDARYGRTPWNPRGSLGT